MSVHRYKNHLVFYMEDRPYKDIVNGIKLLENINDGQIDDTKKACGG